MGTLLFTLPGSYLMCHLHLFVPQLLIVNTEVRCRWTRRLFYFILIVSSVPAVSLAYTQQFSAPPVFVIQESVRNNVVFILAAFKLISH